MSRTLSVARKYAQAFMNEYSEHITQKEYGVITHAETALKNNPGVLQVLDAPTATQQEKEACIEKLVAHYQLPNVCVQLLQLLSAQNRVTLFPTVLSAIGQLYLEAHNSIEVTIATSMQVTEQQLEDIIQFVAFQAKKEVIAHHEIRPSLIAGVRIESDQFVWDYSIQKQLRNVSST